MLQFDEGVEGKVDKKGAEKEVVSKKADYRRCAGVEVRVRGKFLKGKKTEWNGK